MAVLEYHLYSNQNSWINNVTGFYYGLKITAMMTLWVAQPSPLLDLCRHSNPLALGEFVLLGGSGKVTPFTGSSPPLTIAVSLSHLSPSSLFLSFKFTHRSHTEVPMLYLGSHVSVAWNLIVLASNYSFEGNKQTFIPTTKKKKKKVSCIKHIGIK